MRFPVTYFAKMKDTDKVLYFNRENSFLLEKILLSGGNNRDTYFLEVKIDKKNISFREHEF